MFVFLNTCKALLFNHIVHIMIAFLYVSHRYYIAININANNSSTDSGLLLLDLRSADQFDF